MPRGRKPLPTHLKLVQNTLRPGRVNTSEPVPPAPERIPTPPDFLSKEAKSEWRRVAPSLVALGTLRSVDRGAFAAYCTAFGRARQADEALARFAAKDPATSGLLMKSQGGNAIRNPLLAVSRQAWADCVRYGAEFGLSPSSRSRIVAASPDGEDRDEFDF